MSKSLTINVPQIVQTRNTLNAVPSGSTAEPDYNVKYVPQDLTEAQQAQARQNIGAAAAGETGGATVNEFHYKRGGEEGSYYYYIDCQGYTPAEGDLMVVVFDWPMYPEHNPITLMNGSDNPSFVLLNAPASEYNYYDDIEGTVNTRWMVKLEKVNNVWTAYNVNTVELADWNVNDPTAIGYIKNKPSLPEDAIPEDFRNSIIVYSNVSTTLSSELNIECVYNNGVKTVIGDSKSCSIAVGKNVVVQPGSGLQFNNKNGEYWVWFSSNTIYSNTLFKNAHNNLNIIYYGAGFWNNDFGTNSKIFTMNNSVWQGWCTKPTPIVFVDKPINLWAIGNPSTLPDGFAAYMYVPKARYDEFLSACTTKWPDTPVEKFTEKIIVYDHLAQNGYKLLIVPLEKKNYFYVENTTNATETVTITKNGSAPICSFEISTDTFTWTKLGNTSSTPLSITLPAGEKRYLRGENGARLAAWPIWSEYTNITGMDKVGGNIHSLLFGENFENTDLTAIGDYGTTSYYALAFAYLFYGSTTLVDAGDLILPSKIVPHYGYADMFDGCTNLTTPPQIEALTSVGSNNMGGIFQNCTSLTRTPVLKLEAIPEYCYDHAFAGCSSLTRVENWATSGNDNDQPGAPTDSWLENVAAEGTFVKNPNASNWVSGKNGIPTGWTVVDK